MVGINATNVEVLRWFPGDPLTGLLFFALGFFGALVTVYFYVGEFLPLMGGLTRIRELQIDVSQLKIRIGELRQIWDKELKQLNRMIEEYHREGVDIELVDKRIEAQKIAIIRVETRVAKLEEDLHKKEETVHSERRSLLRAGLVLYLILGGFFSTLLATDVLQAVVIGAGWTTFASTLGLKREGDQASKRREEEAEKGMKIQEKLEEIITESEKRTSDLQKMLEESAKMIQDAYSRGLTDGIERTISLYGKKT